MTYEVAGALACSTQSAEAAISLAWQLGARLPRIAARLEDETLTSPKARAMTETLEQLTDPAAAEARRLTTRPRRRLSSPDRSTVGPDERGSR